jgi:hypothetical protein
MSRVHPRLPLHLFNQLAMSRVSRSFASFANECAAALTNDFTQASIGITPLGIFPFVLGIPPFQFTDCASTGDVLPPMLLVPLYADVIL